MKKLTTLLAGCLLALTLPLTRGADEIKIVGAIDVMGMTKPIPVAVTGFSGEALEVLKFDLYVQGFSFVTPEASPQYVINGSDNGSVTGSLTDTAAKQVVFSRAYNGASTRRQAHALADDIVNAIMHHPGIGQSKIAFKSQNGGYGPGEIYVADFDGVGAQTITSDHAIVAKPAWVPHTLALYYTSYAKGNPDIFYHNLSTGQRHTIASYSGLNTSAAVSPDGSKVAMVVSKSGRPSIWVCNPDGSNPKHVTLGEEDSSPCWSPDGKWICFATKQNGRRRLAKVSAEGGTVQYLSTTGAPSPSEPDWSPDGKWIAFTSQSGNYFNICVMPADGSMPPVVLVSGQNPSWAQNSRTLVYNHGPDGHQALSVLDVFTKQSKDCRRAAGSNSQPAWAR